MAVRRRVDWPIILGPKVPVPTVVEQSVRGKLAALLSAFDEILALDDPDAILRRAVELALERIGLQRAGIFLLDRAPHACWGRGARTCSGALVDEHHIMYDVSDTDAKRSGAPRTRASTSPCSTTARSSSTTSARRASSGAAGSRARRSDPRARRSA